MKLSVIIVNYNVKSLLEQCLLSVELAMHETDGEIIVVDNASADGSCQMVKKQFPKVTLIENNKNIGFSKANNQGIQIAKGEYVLLLNPDTLVPHDCFSRCSDFMDCTPQAGALGVRMIDSHGHYLPESKRGLPTPWVAFCKIFGLTQLFPHSSRFARYYLGHLPSDKTTPIDVLAGAFMFLRRAAIEKSGLLDERFFMYGEDIDLSYRISQCGFTNYYFPETTILHYKGESTRKGSLNYVVLFYRAMLIFSQKHFSNRHNGLFNLLIHLAVYSRALLAVLSRIGSVVFSPLRHFSPKLKKRKPISTLVVAMPEQAQKLKQALNGSTGNYEILTVISPQQLNEQLKATQPQLLVFNINAVPPTTIIHYLEKLSDSKVRVKILNV